MDLTKLQKEILDIINHEIVPSKNDAMWRYAPEYAAIRISKIIEFESIGNCKWQVESGIFKGHVFTGHIHNFDGDIKVIDEGTVGRSYPISFCKRIE